MPQLVCLTLPERHALLRLELLFEVVTVGPVVPVLPAGRAGETRIPMVLLTCQKTEAIILFYTHIYGCCFREPAAACLVEVALQPGPHACTARAKLECYHAMIMFVCVLLLPAGGTLRSE